MAADFTLQNFTLADADRVVQLNQSEVPQVGAISRDELVRLSQEACYFKTLKTGLGKTAGFLLVLNEKGNYLSPNFLWFKARYPRFTYIDRIVVASAHQGRGAGQLFYNDLKSFAAKLGSPVLTCEVNLRPPNPTSLNFHQRFGFQKVGEQATEGGKKTVCLMAMEL
jgi:predicted GNAT superfamily acetyltransferase